MSNITFGMIYPTFDEFKTKMTFNKTFDETDELLYNLLFANFSLNTFRWNTPEPKVASTYLLNKKLYDREKEIYDKTLDSLYSEIEDHTIKYKDGASNPNDETYLTNAVEETTERFNKSIDAIDNYLKMQTPEDRFLKRMSVINGVVGETVSYIAPIDYSGKFSDGTPTNWADINVDRQDGNLIFRVKDTNGGVYTFGMNDKGELYAESVISAPEVETKIISFDKDKNITFESQDGGKLKENGIAIHDANGTDYNTKSLSVKEGITLGGEYRTTWPTGGTGDATFKTGEKVSEMSIGESDTNPDNNIITQSVGNVNYAPKLNYTGDGQTKLNLDASGGEIRVQEDTTPLYNLRKDGINMLNQQITKVVPATNDFELVNGQEVKTIVADTSNGKWDKVYENGTLTFKQLPDGLNSGYSFTGDSSNLDQFIIQGETTGGNDFVSVSRPDLYFSKELDNTFYEFSLVGNFKDIYGGTELWLEDSILITNSEIGKVNYKPFIINVKARQASNQIIYNKEVWEFNVPYLITTANGYVEIQLAEQINYKKTVYQNATDTKPVVSYGQWLTSDKDFRINNSYGLTQTVGDSYTKQETDTLLGEKVDKQRVGSAGTGAYSYLTDGRPFIEFESNGLASGIKKTEIYIFNNQWVLRCFNGEGIEIECPITRENGITTKKYVDDKIANPIRKLAMKLGLQESEVNEILMEKE